jgi:hypothetical protein
MSRKKTLSQGLSERHIKYREDGHQLIDDSKITEKILISSITDIIFPYCQEKIKTLFGGDIKIVYSISLYELQCILNKYRGEPEPNINNKNVCMKPDGGIIFAIINNIEYPILIIEDKVQGTNDLRNKNGKKKQSLGNAIERAAKNVRGAEMLFSSNLNIFPYALFASGCDFHSSGTIAKRIEMMNYGYPNHTIELEKNRNIDIEHEIVAKILPNIDINKKNGLNVISAFVKTHKWDELEHGSSRWAKNEYAIICCDIIDKVIIKLGEHLALQ